ncbi:N-acetyltransferase [bacterium SCSIO 12741]|nr:N-acetyltransferase [bacterium SCSIO 12741]
MQHPLTIRQERREDFERVHDILDRAFRGTNESRLVAELRRDIDFVPELALVGCNENDLPIGTIFFSHLGIDNHAGRDLLALAPMAVDPAMQLKGIGSQLVVAGLEKARAMGFRGVIVLGHSEYYPKFGFERASKWNIHCPLAVSDERFMGIELRPGGLLDLSGIVRYATSFGI